MDPKRLAMIHIFFSFPLAHLYSFTEPLSNVCLAFKLISCCDTFKSLAYIWRVVEGGECGIEGMRLSRDGNESVKHGALCCESDFVFSVVSFGPPKTSGKA